MDTSPVIVKTYTAANRALDAEAGIFEALITTETPDRSQDVIVAGGGRFENYLRNPVVLWAHRYGEPPIGRALGVSPVPRGVSARFQFAPPGISERADEVHALWQAGFLNTVSIGILPLKQEPVDPQDGRWFAPQRYLEWEMLEFSIVPIPMNPDAVRLSLARAGIWATEEERIAEQHRALAQLMAGYLAELKQVLTATDRLTR
jgi:phage head maturation protease